MDPNVLLNDNDHIAANVDKDLYRIVRPRLHDPVTKLEKVPDPWGTYERLLRRVPSNDEEGRLTHIKPDLNPQYEASGSSSHNLDPNPLPEIPSSFEDIFGDNIDPQYSTRSESSSYHPELHPETRTPTIKDIFPLAPLVTQYPFTLDYGVYDYSTFLSTPDGPPEAGPNNYQTSERGARHHRRRHPDHYTPALGTSPGSRQF
ncbi:hypothetical protein J1N35_012294 [Gossypium stocksii]|uniref:Uncharacterized protein n=1 Tax=Gossypium stocksii TaxID=47602 RepID=A0A9D4AEC8_9ROSI|nr:hypothetical protein J1N35_012294 [Gossypium stocksii]